jgi:hypothetical protein
MCDFDKELQDDTTFLEDENEDQITLHTNMEDFFVE